LFASTWRRLHSTEAILSDKLSDIALDQLFRVARTRNGWTDRPVSEQQLRELYDLVKLGPTSGNCCPARFVWIRSAEAKKKLAAFAAPNNAPKILAAPVTVIVGYDLDFGEQMPKLFPARGKDMKAYFADPEIARSTAFRNSSLQGAYLIFAARSLGLDCGPMSGFSNEAVDAEFFADTRIKSNFICSVGYGSDENLFPRNPRLTFEESGRFA
jgi:nitroreductase